MNFPDIPVPLGATCCWVEQPPQRSFRSGGSRYTKYDASTASNLSAGAGDCLFAFSFDTGSIHVYKISSRDDILTMFDLKQANIFTRLFSGITTSILR